MTLSPIGSGAFTSQGNVLCESEDPLVITKGATFDTSGLFTPKDPGIAFENRLRLCSFLLHNKRRTRRRSTRITAPTAMPTVAPVDNFFDTPVDEVSLLLLPTGALITVTSVVLEVELRVNEGSVCTVELVAVVVVDVEFKDNVEL
jgi:hypothetical protein